MNDKPTWATVEQVNEMDDQRSIVGAALANEQMDFVVDFEVKAESALKIARRRWQYAELITGEEANHE